MALLHAVISMALSVDQPLVDMHSFRQTQTALTAYWLAHGGPVFAYQTPVLGAPWSVPFEFPLFQSLSALVFRLGVPLDAAGRLVSFCFFLGILWPLRSLYRSLGLGEVATLTTEILFLTCPVYLYWGRSFMMETCALFFGLLWLSLVARYASDHRLSVATATFCAGCGAVLVKATTFPPFGALGAILIAVQLVQGRQRGWALVWFTVTAAAFTVGPLMVGYAWVLFTDTVKSRSELGLFLTSQALTAWNLGSIEQKASGMLWIDTIWKRALPDTLGISSSIGLITLGASLISRRHLAHVSLSLAAFLLAFIMFTNLHIVHRYYQAANAIFLIAAVGIALARLGEIAGPAVSSASLMGLIAGQIGTFYLEFYPATQVDAEGNRMYRIARMAHDRTAPEESLIVIGDDWSSLVPYYARRKSLVLPPWAPESVVGEMASDPRALLGDSRLGAVVYCPDMLAFYGDRAAVIARFAAGRTKLGEIDGCGLLSPEKAR